MNTAQESRKRSRAIRRLFFGYVDLKKRTLTTHQLCILNVIWYLAPRKSVIQLCLGACWSWPRTRARWPTFWCTSDEFENVLQDLYVNKGSGSDGIPPIFWRTVHLLSHYLFFLKSRWQRAFFPTGGRFQKLLVIFKKRRCNNYRGVAILSAIPKRFELLV
jgi:hypothetical protein